MSESEDWEATIKKLLMKVNSGPHTVIIALVCTTI